MEFAFETTPGKAIVVTPQPDPSAASGPVIFALKAFTQDSSYAQVGSRTNITETPSRRSITTNTVTVFESKTATTSLDSAFILGLLENSFNINFPGGAKLIISGEGSFSFFVVDPGGSNILLNAGGVLSIADNLSVNSGRETFTRTVSSTATNISGNDVETFTEFADLTYNDAGLATKDGTHTELRLSGILVQRRSTGVTTARFRESITLEGAGAGTIRGKSNIILKGIVTGKVNSAVR